MVYISFLREAERYEGEGGLVRLVFRVAVVEWRLNGG